MTLIIALCFTAANLAGAETTGDTRLTHDGTFKRDLRFLQNGAQLVYGIDEGPALIRVMRIHLEGAKSGSDPEPLFEDVANKHHVEPGFSPDEKFVSFTECTGNLTARLIIRNIATSKDAYVTHSGRGGTRSPVFSPDGERVIYAFAATGPQQLWSVNLEGKDKKQLTQSQGVSNWPTFTPDGKTIVFANSRENNYEIYTMNADGSDEKRLTHNSIMDIRPAVSPDGKRIAFVSTRDGGYNVYLMNIDGSNVQALTQREDRDDFPWWHPNGRQLAIVSERSGKFDIYLIDVPLMTVVPANLQAAQGAAGAGEP